ncbi:MAG: tRNA-guanine transglycosylase [Desulfurococcales archaeon]|nr:tRNA-guanine transglycosylase [Desulfurococcales archaeon]
MKRRKPLLGELIKLRAILSYQFGDDVSSLLLGNPDEIEVDVTSRGKIRNVYKSGERILTLRPNDNLYSLGLGAAKLIVSGTSPPRLRIIVRGDRELRGSVLARDIVSYDEDLRPGDECVIVDRDDNLIGVGRVKISPHMIDGLDRGEIVRVRHKR